MPQAAAPSAVPHESNPADAFEQAKRSLAQGQLDQALSEAKLGLARAPRSVLGLNLLGVIYNQQGKYEEAAMQFQQALAIAPNSVETLVNLANSLAAQNKPELAELTLKKALRVQPGNKTADYNLAAVLLGHNKAKEALTYLLRIPSPDQTTRLMVVRAYLDAGMPATGMAAAEKLSKDFAKDTRVHFSLGVLLASHRKYRESAYEFEKADALQPGDFDILHDLGEAYLLSGQLPKAQESLNQALRSNPDSADTLYLLAQTSAGMHKEVDALELLVRARKVAPNNTNILFLMAQLSMKQSFFEDAIEVPGRAEPRAVHGPARALDTRAGARHSGSGGADARVKVVMPNGRAEHGIPEVVVDSSGHADGMKVERVFVVGLIMPPGVVTTLQEHPPGTLHATGLSAWAARP